MAKKTLLEIVQDIMSDMDSDNVNSISDTDEATQVAQIVKSTYDAMIANRNWPHTKRLISLQASTDLTLPTHMTITDDIKELISIYYDKHKQGETQLKYQEVKWMEPDDFLYYTNQRNSTSSTVLTVTDTSGIQLLIYNNIAPTYYTSFNDQAIVFDSYDSAIDSTLQTSKTQARAYVIPSFSLSNTVIPDLPLEAFPSLIEEAKSKAQFKLHQMTDSKAEQESKRQSSWLSRKAWTINGGIKYPNYGRGRGGSNRSDEPTFRNEN